MKIKIMTPEHIFLEKDVTSVTLPGGFGELTALDGHDFLATEVRPGRLFIRFPAVDGKSKREDYKVSSGCAEIRKDSVNVFVGSVENAG